MTTENKLDQLVKGAPDPATSTSRVTQAAISDPPSISAASSLLESKRPTLNPRESSQISATTATTDPLFSTLPSSPPQIYLNLLILEASLRSQYLSLLVRRRTHTFFGIILGLQLIYSTYLLFFRVREDDNGHGGSPYYWVDVGIKTFWLGGLLTLLMTQATGVWERGYKWPKRWVAITNRGLRPMNLKVVILKGPWWKQALGQVAWLLALWYLIRPGTATVGTYRWLQNPERASKIDGKYAYRENSANKPPSQAFLTHHNHPHHHHTSSSSSSSGSLSSSQLKEEDISPAGDTVRLMLLPKQFSAEFRDGWEKYRDAYWTRENQRRADLRAVVSQLDHDKARLCQPSADSSSSMSPWTQFRRLFGLAPESSAPPSPPRDKDKEKERDRERARHSARHGSISTGTGSGSSRTRERDGSLSQRKPRRSSVLRDDVPTRSSSRSSTATPDPDDPRQTHRLRRAPTPRLGSSGTSTPTQTSTRQTRSQRLQEESAPGSAQEDADADADELGDGFPSHSGSGSGAAHDLMGSPSSAAFGSSKEKKSPTSRLRHRSSNLSDAGSTASEMESDYSSASGSATQRVRQRDLSLFGEGED